VTSLTLNKFVNGDYMSFLDSLPIMENDIIVFYLGEIDFRYNLHLAVNKKQLSTEKLVSDLLLEYHKTILKIKEQYNNHIVIMSPNPPMRDNHLSQFIEGSESSRILCWSMFDKFWKTNSNGEITYLNWTKKYTLEDKLINVDLLHENNHHIKNYDYCIDELSKTLKLISNKPVVHNDAKSLVDYCLNNDLMNKCIFMQVYEEILTLSYWLEGFKPNNILEIGTMGSTFWIMSQLSTGKKVSVDIEPRDSIVHHFMYGEDWKHFVGNSQTMEMFEDVKNFCPKFDFIFIDGDHTYDGVKKDFELYKNLLSPRGVIGFHDIDPNHIFADSYAGQVYKFWQDLNEGTKMNLVCTKSSGNVKLNGTHQQGFGGIGLWMP
jgi:predicted O-methyltransferase YrrM